MTPCCPVDIDVNATEKVEDHDEEDKKSKKKKRKKSKRTKSKKPKSREKLKPEGDAVDICHPIEKSVIESVIQDMRAESKFEYDYETLPVATLEDAEHKAAVSLRF